MCGPVRLTRRWGYEMGHASTDAVRMWRTPRLVLLGQSRSAAAGGGDAIPDGQFSEGVSLLS